MASHSPAFANCSVPTIRWSLAVRNPRRQAKSCVPLDSDAPEISRSATTPLKPTPPPAAGCSRRREPPPAGCSRRHERASRLRTHHTARFGAARARLARTISLGTDGRSAGARRKSACPGRRAGQREVSLGTVLNDAPRARWLRRARRAGSCNRPLSLHSGSGGISPTRHFVRLLNERK